MPLDARVRRFLDALAAGKPPSARGVGIAERRARLTELLRLSGAMPEIGGTRDEVIPGPGGPLAVRLYSPPMSVGALPGLLYFHGGGMVAGSIDTHGPIAQSLCHAAACRIVSVEYRLAPEHPFPAGLEDAIAAFRYIAARASDFGLDPARLGVCGDSAGGTLAAAVCQTLARAGAARPALQVLLCPILDYGRRSASRIAYASGYLVDEETLEHDLEHYAPGGADPDDPRISPLRAGDLSGVPPTLVHTAEFDPLRDEGEEYFRRLTPGGSGLAYTCHPGMIHLFYGLGAVIPYARTAFGTIGAQIRAALDVPGALK